MAVVAWPIADSGIRDVAEVAAAADARGYEVCTVGLEAMWAYGIARQRIPWRNDHQCDVLISIGTWRPGGYDDTRNALPYRAEFGDVPIAAAVDIANLIEGPDDGSVLAAAQRRPSHCCSTTTVAGRGSRTNVR